MTSSVRWLGSLALLSGVGFALSSPQVQARDPLGHVVRDIAHPIAGNPHYGRGGGYGDWRHGSPVYSPGFHGPAAGFNVGYQPVPVYYAAPPHGNAYAYPVYVNHGYGYPGWRGGGHHEEHRDHDEDH